MMSPRQATNCTVSVITPRELSPELRRRWLQIVAGEPRLRSPYFHPDFCQAVGSVRSDARVAVIRDESANAAQRIVGFFGFQQQGSRGRPLAGRLSDFQAVIGPQHLPCSAIQLTRACGLATLEFDHLLASETAFSGHRWLVDGSPFMDLSGGWDAYVARRLRRDSRELAQARRKVRKLSREMGPLRLEWQAVDREHVLRQTLAWKSAQYRRTGITDVFSFPWTVQLLRDLAARTTADFQGVLSALYAGRRLVATHFGMRAGSVLHYWFPTYDPQLGCYSPGLALLLGLAAEGPAAGVLRIDLGRGMSRYKTALMTGVDEVMIGAVDLRPLARRLLWSWRHARDWVKQSPFAGSARVPGQVLYRVKEWLEFR